MRCPLDGKPDCKVHSWEETKSRLRAIVPGLKIECNSKILAGKGFLDRRRHKCGLCSPNSRAKTNCSLSYTAHASKGTLYEPYKTAF